VRGWWRPTRSPAAWWSSASSARFPGASVAGQATPRRSVPLLTSGPGPQLVGTTRTGVSHMLKRLFIVPLAAFLLAGAANAGTLQTLRIREQPHTADQLAAEVVEVQTHRSPVAIIAQD